MKLFTVLSFMSALFISSVAYAEEPKHNWTGLQFDVGVPDGAALGAVFRPVNSLRFTFSGTYNVMAPGVRGGLTFDPIKFPIVPTLTVEGGHAFQGKLPVDKAPELSYNYVNFHFGLEAGKRDSWRLFLHAGPSYLDVSTAKFQENVVSNKSVTMADPTVKGWVVPTAKLGFAVFF